MGQDFRIVAHGISKRYKLGVVASLQKLFKKTPKKELWALDDVNLEVGPGECLGVVGRNGAGKSTLLKVLCGVTTPTRGHVERPKRVIPLIELTAGFHPELTGRDNVYLNGALLGMTRRDLARRFDAIVDFSGIEKFIDTPVKKYSSGMLVRLAFSTAIHVDPEAMLVDEVLSVGDLAFALKATRAVADIQKGGVPIVFVSHNLQHIRNVCKQAVWLDAGKIAARGKTNDVIAAYARSIYTSPQADPTDFGEMQRHHIDPTITITKVEITDAAGRVPDCFATGDDLALRIHYETTRATEPLQFQVAFYHAETGVMLIDQNTVDDEAPHPGCDGPTRGMAVMRLARQPFLGGKYRVSTIVTENHPDRAADWHEKMYGFAVAGGHVGYGAFYGFPAWSFEQHLVTEPGP